MRAASPDGLGHQRMRFPEAQAFVADQSIGQLSDCKEIAAGAIGHERCVYLSGTSAPASRLRARRASANMVKTSG